MKKSIGLAFILASTTIAADLSGGKWAVGNEYAFNSKSVTDSGVTLLFTENHVLKLSIKNGTQVLKKSATVDGIDLYAQGDTDPALMAKTPTDKVWITSGFARDRSEIKAWAADSTRQAITTLTWTKGPKTSQPKQGTMTDPRDNSTYNTITFGGKTWMAQDLHFRTPNSTCPWSNQLQKPNCDIAVLYPFEDRDIACPPKWHQPSNAEWIALTVAVIQGEKFTGELKQSFWTDPKGFAAAGPQTDPSNTPSYWTSSYVGYANKSAIEITASKGFSIYMDSNYPPMNAMRCVAD